MYVCVKFLYQFLVTFVKTWRNSIIIHIKIWKTVGSIYSDWLASCFVRFGFKTLLDNFSLIFHSTHSSLFCIWHKTLRIFLPYPCLWATLTNWPKSLKTVYLHRPNVVHDLTGKTGKPNIHFPIFFSLETAMWHGSGQCLQAEGFQCVGDKCFWLVG